LGAILLLFSLSSGLLLPSAWAEPSATYEGERVYAQERFEYRDSIASSASLSHLGRRPEKLLSVLDDPQNGEKEGERRLYTLTDFHAVFPLDLEEIIPVFLDMENEEEVYGRVVETHDISPGASPMAPHFQEVRTAFKFFGIGSEQHYILYKVPERISEDEFLIKWNLVESMDGQLYCYYGSWYLRRLEAEGYSGESRTYVRNYARIGFIEPPRGFKLAHKLFSSKELRRFFEEVYRAARPERDKAD